MENVDAPIYKWMNDLWSRYTFPDLREEALDALTTDLVRLSVIVTEMLWSIAFSVP